MCTRVEYCVVTITATLHFYLLLYIIKYDIILCNVFI